MHFLETLNDNQLALLGCGLALLASGTLMSLSYYFGPNGRHGARRSKTPATDIIPYPKTDENTTDVLQPEKPHHKAA